MSEAVGKIFNIGSGRETKILELAQKINALTGSDSGFDFRPLPEDDPIQRKPDITMASELFDWQPRIELDEGLEKTVGYFRELLNSSDPR